MGQQCCSDNLRDDKQVILRTNTVESVATKLSVEKYFPGAMKGHEVDEHVFTILTGEGFTDDNTLYADCSCPDEINHDDPEEDITSLMTKRWGEIFPLAGLAGFPFTGRTGWGAFSAHVPKDGHILVLYAPHVGVDVNGKVGSITRDGQDEQSSACGAAIGAYAAIKADITAGDFKGGYHDHQMDLIKHLLVPKIDKIKNSENEQAELAFQMFELQNQFLEDIIHLNWQGPNSKLAMMGGIMINCDGEKTDKFLPLKFEIRTKQANRDVFEQCFGFQSVRKYGKENILSQLKFAFQKKQDELKNKKEETPGETSETGRKQV